jgi:hypothetical protein
VGKRRFAFNTNADYTAATYSDCGVFFATRYKYMCPSFYDTGYLSMAGHKIPYAPVNNSNWNTIENFGTVRKNKNFNRIKLNLLQFILFEE